MIKISQLQKKCVVGERRNLEQFVNSVYSYALKIPILCKGMHLSLSFVLYLYLFLSICKGMCSCVNVCLFTLFFIVK